MPKIDPSVYLRNNQPDKSRTPSPELGRDEFLKILMTQLQNQDPLNPMEDKDFISQMSNFSSLEQLMNISSSIESLVQNQAIAPVVQYSNLIGRDVAYHDDEGSQKVSQVTAVSQQDGQALLKLANGETIPANEIGEVSTSQ
ncbi:flagellar hook assembly protein FlgD [Ornithinibacillus halophilus]|uniref:Flagellar basal-body rod modification protein FlgD n=1 Tax=Ornithinibacillus halophilus TaxID=930117 RepID=A0A1M5CA97_9BACI|nr:flagellar hook assembly protein FlgD [Ornithinibacillus halophilus]SHF51655.1 flagellar basal-body rod modification protein FlgD [Ornithinibacillus halophilus]